MLIIRLSDVVGSASSFGRTSRATSRLHSKMDLASMTRKERFAALPVVPPLALSFNLESFALESQKVTDTGGTLDRFEQLVLQRSGPEISVCRMRGSDPSAESALVISEPEGCSIKLYGWVRAVPTGTSVEWWLMASELRRFKTPAFVNSHFAGLDDDSQRANANQSADDHMILYDLAAGACQLALSGTRSHAGMRAAQRLKVLIELCLFDAATRNDSTPRDNRPPGQPPVQVQGENGIRRRRE